MTDMSKNLDHRVEIPLRQTGIAIMSIAMASRVVVVKEQFWQSSQEGSMLFGRSCYYIHPAHLSVRLSCHLANFQCYLEQPI